MWQRRLCRCNRKWKIQVQTFYCQTIYLWLLCVFSILLLVHIGFHSNEKIHAISKNCDITCNFADLLFERGIDRSFKTFKKFNEFQNTVVFPAVTDSKNQKIANNHLETNCERLRAKISFEKVHQIQSDNVENVYLLSKILFVSFMWAGITEKEAFLAIFFLFLLSISPLFYIIKQSELDNGRGKVIFHCDRMYQITKDLYQSTYFTEEFYDNFC